ncbi:MAG: hypothetical protein K8S27_10550 [Candidatus Omnitrophica bacterium]|nr:hypothetical protein [Candidatus Omnitrophota bacterium]
MGNDFIFTKNNGEKAIFPHGSEAQQSWERGIRLLADLFIKQRGYKLEKKHRKEQRLETEIIETDKKILRQAIKRSDKKYNFTQTAKILGVHRETMYYWIKHGWITPKRDYRNIIPFSQF